MFWFELKIAPLSPLFLIDPGGTGECGSCLQVKGLIRRLRIPWTGLSRQAQVALEGRSPCLWHLTLECFQLCWEDGTGSSQENQGRAKRCTCSSYFQIHQAELIPHPRGCEWGPIGTRKLPLMKDPLHRNWIAEERCFLTNVTILK